MTKLETLFEYARTLPIDAQDALAADLADAMARGQQGLRLTPQQIKDVQNAVSESNPVLAASEDVERVFGTPFR